MSGQTMFFVQVGQLVCIIVQSLVTWWMISISCGCYDRMKDHLADYRYDLNVKSHAFYRMYQTITALPILLAIWLWWWLFNMLGAV